MKKSLVLLLFLSLFAIFLAACNSAEEGTESVEEHGQTETQKEEKSENGENNATGQEEDDEEALETNGDAPASETSPGSIEEIKEKKISYTINGETKEGTAVLTESDNLNISLYVLPEYTFTPEEPNKDQIYLTSDGEIFMRIERISGDADWNLIENMTKEELALLNEDVQSEKVPNDPFFKSAAAFSASDGSTVKKAYLIKNEELPLKLTLFLKEGNDHSDPFLKMAATIKKSN